MLMNSHIQSMLAKKIPFKLKIISKYFLSNKDFYPIISKVEDKIFVAIAADYGNLGDIAITYAQISYLKEQFQSHKIVTIYANDVYLLKRIKSFIRSSDILTIIGGGNMGDAYQVLEDSRRYIIKLFPENKIISFPQSIDFKTVKSLKKSIKVYSKHPNLHIFARESTSYETMKESFKNNHVYLAPDIVLSLKNMDSKAVRDGIILCLRSDKEQKLTKQQKESLIETIKQKYANVKAYDTYIPNLPKELGQQELMKLFDAFKKTGVVITDRLHGMIFCAIKKTPCVVLPNSNHKIAGTYNEWLADLRFIIFTEETNPDQILEYINKLYHDESDELNIRVDLRDKFQPLDDALKSEKVFPKSFSRTLRNFTKETIRSL
ncbi:polysaccharide pyruvyl transferase family protein [Bacillus sp. B-jedd]|uniref:polysaccharide pyruvyl transferase family protein n=1 Tax=Bacillus sp. B-jedd TaxID=1476857 RepID=UPI00051555F5|nr:polysaccharide pyruvyl transferase family protein [Bacillus sp. B-jedd]CEG28637.1 polysaccharide pyruvyl transferase [Bacillus sp. B-jedd]